MDRDTFTGGVKFDVVAVFLKIISITAGKGGLIVSNWLNDRALEVGYHYAC